MRSKCEDCGHNIITHHNQKTCDYGVFHFPDTPDCIYYLEGEKAKVCKNCSNFIKEKNNCKLNTENKMPDIKSCWLFTTDDNRIKKQVLNNIQKRLEAI